MDFGDEDDDAYLNLDLPDGDDEEQNSGGETEDENLGGENASETAAHENDGRGDDNNAAPTEDNSDNNAGEDNSDNNAGEDNNNAGEADNMYSIKQYIKIFAKQNPKHGTTKIAHSNPPMSFVRMRVKIPNRGKSEIYVAEGMQCQIGKDTRLLCPGRKGRTKYFDNGKNRFIVLGCIWVSSFCSLVLHACFAKNYTPHIRSAVVLTGPKRGHVIPP